MKTKIIKKPITTHDGVLVYTLPNMSRYGLSKTGELYDFKIKRYKPWWATKAPILNKKNITHGYRVTSGLDDNGNLKRISRHRMLLSIFKPTENMDKLFVNHINGIPGDDRLDNLEWVTPRENLIHAINNGLMPNSVIGIDMLNIKTNEIKHFISVAEAARYLNWTHGKLLNRLNKNVKYFDNLIFKKSSDPEFKLNNRIVLMGVRREIVAVFPNGEIEHYPTIMHASSGTGVNTTSITQTAKLNNGKMVKGYKFYFKENFITVPLHSNM